jgi:hypothetical protein
MPTRASLVADQHPAWRQSVTGRTIYVRPGGSMRQYPRSGRPGRFWDNFTHA